MLTANSSSYGRGAVLRQKDEEGKWKPIVYASRTLSTTEKRYVQIEKEALALTWACEKFHEFIYGLSFKLETDHKPLIFLLRAKSLDELNPRLQRMRMRLMHYDYDIYYIPGKDIIVADCLFRLPQFTYNDEELDITSKCEFHVFAISKFSDLTITKLLQGQHSDETCQYIICLPIQNNHKRMKI